VDVRERVKAGYFTAAGLPDILARPEITARAYVVGKCAIGPEQPVVDVRQRP